MRVKNLSLLLHIDEVTLRNILEEQLTKNPNIDTQASVPILGEIEIGFSQMKVHGIKFAEKGIAIEMASDVNIHLPRIGNAVRLAVGCLFLDT